METQVSFRCDADLKKMIIQAAKVNGYRKYQKFLRDVVEKTIRVEKRG